MTATALTVAVRTQRPRAVDRLRSLDDVGVQPGGAHELGELGDLFELPTVNVCSIRTGQSYA